MKIFKNNQLYFVIYFLVLALVIPKYGLLARYPWQDLIYTDFQIFNRWRWFSESLHQSGLINTLTSNTDFRMNTGENLYLSSRVSAPIYDVGAWLYFITGSLDVAFFSKYLVLTLLSAFGLIGLIERSTSIKKNIPNTKFLIFAVTLASLMGHPLMMHEVGPMVLWYLFLTPCWILIFLDTRDYGVLNMLSSWKTYALIIFTIGSSDLFVFFYFPLFFSLAFIDKSKIYIKLKNIFISVLLIEIVLIVSKIPYFYYSTSGSNISHSGSSGILDYVKNFVAPLFLSLFLPFFWGPVIIFLNFILIGLILYFGFKHLIIFKKYLIIWSSMLLILLLFGISLHTFPITREALPSAFRYHVAPWSIFLIAMLPLFINDVLKNRDNRPSLEGHKNVVILLVILAILSLSNIEQFYTSVVSPGSKRIVDYDIRKWLMTDLPNCIKKNTNKTVGSTAAPQYVFLTANEENGRNDNLTSLIENPWALNGRTFNQYRYSTSKSNNLSTLKFGLNGLFNSAFTQENLSKSIEYSKLLGINYLITTISLKPSEETVFLGECKVPNNLRSRFEPFKWLLGQYERGNTSYQKNLFVYKIKNNQNLVVASGINSNTIKYSILCDEKKVYTLPTNYSSDLIVTNYINAELVPNTDTNLTNLNIKSCTEGKIEIEIKSQSKILYFDVIFLFFYIALSFFLLFRNNRNRQ